MTNFDLPRWSTNQMPTKSLETAEAKSLSRTPSDDTEGKQPSKERRPSNKPVTNTQALLQVAVSKCPSPPYSQQPR